MEVEIFNYKISPYSGNLCWKIQEKQTKEGTKAEWREPYYYPSTFECALLKVKELVGMDDEAKVKTLDEALEEYRKILAEFELIAKDFPIQYAEELNKLSS